MNADGKQDELRKNIPCLLIVINTELRTQSSCAVRALSAKSRFTGLKAGSGVRTVDDHVQVDKTSVALWRRIFAAA